MRSWLKWGTISLCGLIGLAVGSYVGFVFYLEHALKQEIARLRMDKILLRYDELIPPVPEAENAVPVLRELLRNIVEPPDSLPTLAKYGNNPDNTPEEIASLEEWVNTNSHVFALMKNVLNKKYYRMEVPMLLIDVFSNPDVRIKLANLYKLYDISIFLSLRNHRYEKAINYIDEFMKLTIMYQKSCTSSAEYIVTAHYSGILASYIDIVISKNDISESQLQTFLSAQNQLDFPNDVRQSLKGEAIFEYTTVLSLCNNKNILRIISPNVLKLFYFYYFNDIFKDLPQYIELTTMPYYLTNGKAEMLEAKHKKDTILGHYTQIYPKIFYETLPNVEARWDILRLKLAIIIHMKKYKRMPESLHAIDKSILSTIPVDPFTGAEYEYIVTGSNSFSLSSRSFEQRLPVAYRIQKNYTIPARTSPTGTPEYTPRKLGTQRAAMPKIRR